MPGPHRHEKQWKRDSLHRACGQCNPVTSIINRATLPTELTVVMSTKKLSTNYLLFKTNTAIPCYRSTDLIVHQLSLFLFNNKSFKYNHFPPHKSLTASVSSVHSILTLPAF